MSDPLEEIYKDVFEDALEYMKTYKTQEVAATYVAIALRLYKTSLSDEGYRNMIKTIMETEVKPYKDTLH